MEQAKKEKILTGDIVDHFRKNLWSIFHFASADNLYLY